MDSLGAIDDLGNFEINGIAAEREARVEREPVTFGEKRDRFLEGTAHRHHEFRVETMGDVVGGRLGPGGEQRCPALVDDKLKSTRETGFDRSAADFTVALDRVAIAGLKKTAFAWTGR